MWVEIGAAFRDLSYAGVRAIVLTGANGDFCTGADLGGGGSGGGAPRAMPPMVDSMRVLADVVLAVHDCPVPVVAKVDGLCVGAGLGLALAADVTYCSDRARFSAIFAKRGLSLDFGGSWILPRLIGMHRAKELALLAPIIGAAEAAEIGLVNRVLPDAELDAFVDGWVAELAAGPPIALAMTKRMLNNSFNVTLEEALDDEGVSQTVNLGTADNREAIAAFLAKRAPNFEGR
jgi:enoyl-CoA hydratase/carnithine racemase